MLQANGDYFNLSTILLSLQSTDRDVFGAPVCTFGRSLEPPQLQVFNTKTLWLEVEIVRLWAFRLSKLMRFFLLLYTRLSDLGDLWSFESMGEEEIYNSNPPPFQPQRVR